VKFNLTYKERLAGLFLMLSLLMVSLFIAGAALENSWFKAKTSYHLYVNRGEGLMPGSPVLLSGVKIGEIDTLTLMKDNRIDVK
jgi:ABC-type transporter Mla subunit MlaD